MKTLNVIVIIFLALLFMRCGKTPTARFETDKDFYYAGETIHFKNTSTEGESYHWTFPDGSTSTEKEPSFVIPSNTTEEYIPIQLKAFSKKERKSNSLGKSVNISLPVYNNEFFTAQPDFFKPLYKSNKSMNGYQYTIFIRGLNQTDGSNSEFSVHFNGGSRPNVGNHWPNAGVRFQLVKRTGTSITSYYNSGSSGNVEITELPDNKLLMKLSNIILYETYSGSSSEMDAEIIF